MAQDHMKEQLLSFQKSFISSLFLNSEAKCDFTKSLRPAGKLQDPKSSLNIHRQGYFCRLADAMAESFAGVLAALNEKTFYSLVFQYIKENPSSTYDLNQYGQNFPQFLHQSIIYQKKPFVHDLALLDLSFAKVFHEAQHQAIAPKKLLVIEKNPKIKLTLAPSLRFLALDYAIYPSWSERLTKPIDKAEKRSQFLIIFKQNYRVHIKAIKEVYFIFLQKLSKMMSIENAINETDHIKKEDILEIFYLLVSCGLVLSYK